MARSPSFAAATAAAAMLACACAAAPPPNAIVFLVDDWGWGDLGANGFGAETPSMDRYAAKGVLFSDFHANSVCTPTRSALQTGRLNMRMGVTGNFDVDSKGGLALGEITVAELLQRGANYSTSATGKVRWRQEAFLDAAPPLGLTP
jgi:arylsulfatase A-like enzyme